VAPSIFQKAGSLSLRYVWDNKLKRKILWNRIELFHSLNLPKTIEDSKTLSLITFTKHFYHMSFPGFLEFQKKNDATLPKILAGRIVAYPYKMHLWMKVLVLGQTHLKFLAPKHIMIS
jgi:hypothetical protein